MKEFLLNLHINDAKTKVTHDWTMHSLDKTLKTLKNNKARDEYQHTYELFKYGGKSLKLSLLNFFNAIKIKQVYPSIMQISNITSLWKRKGDRSNLDNDRGIFNVPKIRSILDKMIYNDIYQVVDSHMSSSNIGARKNRNIRDHLFVTHAIINDTVNNKQSKAIDLQIFDVAKCFDKLEYTSTALDFHQAGVKDDKFLIVANSNTNCDVAIKTPMGKTNRTKLKKIEMQGTVLAGLKCSVSIDSIGKEALESTDSNLYRYKNCISIPPLSFIDDILAVTVCSPDSVQQCSLINAKLEGKQLRLHCEKCSRMHIGKQRNCIEYSTKTQTYMRSSSKERYLGDILTSDAKVDENIKDRYNKGIGYINQIVGILKEISFGKHYFEQALLFRTAKFINGILCSIESIHGLTRKHIEKLESCD